MAHHHESKKSIQKEAFIEEAVGKHQYTEK